MNNIFLSAQIDKIEYSELVQDTGTVLQRYYFNLYKEEDREDYTSAINLRATWTPKIKDRERAATLKEGDDIIVSGRIGADINGKLIVRIKNIEKISQI